MAATPGTWFSPLDGYGSYDEERANWGGHWSKHGPELLKHRLAQFADEQRMVFGANTFREQVALAGPNSQGGSRSTHGSTA